MKKVRIIILVVAVITCLCSCSKNCSCETTYETTLFTRVSPVTSVVQSSFSTPSTVHIGQAEKCSDLNYRNVDSLENEYRVESRTCEEELLTVSINK